MKLGRGSAVQRHLEAIFEGQSVASLGEGQLLERFVERRDEPAFAALVARHGPMVLSVCRRVLIDPMDVEDAFQATFLVLIRRAGSLRDRDQLAPWLFGVARKVASRARSDVARRRAREGSGVEDLASNPRPDDPARELGRALVEEIDRLPGSLRGAVLLCFVEGFTYDEAAIRLGSTAPAIRGRLARAREQLRARLSRRGFAPTVGVLGGLLSVEAASASVPSHLLKTTIQVAKAGAVPAGVDILADGVIRTMIVTKSKILAAALVACGIAGSTVGLNAQNPTDAPAPKSENVDRIDQVEKKLDRLLNALEGRMSSTSPSPAPAPSPTPPAPPSPPAVTGRSPFDLAFPATPQPPSAPLPPEPPSQPAQDGKPRAQTFPRPERRKSSSNTTNGIGSMPPGLLQAPGAGNLAPGLTGRWPAAAAGDLSRIDALEQKLRGLEARIDGIERRLGPESKPPTTSRTNLFTPSRSSRRVEESSDIPSARAKRSRDSSDVGNPDSEGESDSFLPAGSSDLAPPR